MTLRLEVLGSSGSWPAPGSPTSGYVVDDGDTRVVLDLGFGTMPRLPDPLTVDAVVLTHRHPDHCVDVLALYHLWAYGEHPRAGIPLLAPRSTIDALAAFVAPGAGSRFWEVFAVEEVEPGERQEVGSLGLDFHAVDHSVPTVGVRVEGGGRSLFYTADTGDSGDWWQAVETSDLVLAEATWQGEGDPGSSARHLTASQAGVIAQSLGAQRLVLTHLRPGLDPVRSVAEAQKTFPGPVTHAVPGLMIEV